MASGPHFSTVQWIQWLSATCVAVAMVVSFAYSNFQTKSEAVGLNASFLSSQDALDKRLDRIAGRLDRIENKIDRIIEARHERKIRDASDEAVSEVEDPNLLVSSSK